MRGSLWNRSSAWEITSAVGKVVDFRTAESVLMPQSERKAAFTWSSSAFARRPPRPQRRPMRSRSSFDWSSLTCQAK